MAKGKMHSGYKRHQERIPTSMLIFDAHTKEAARIHEECLDEMEADSDPEDPWDSQAEINEVEVELMLDDFDFDSLDRSEHMDNHFTPLPEDAWQANDFIDPGDRAMGTLRYNMDNVKPDEIFLQDTRWIAKKYSLLTSMIIGELFSEEFFNESTAIIGRYKVALEESLEEFGIEFEPLMGISEAGWETISKFHTNTTVGNIGHC